MVVVHITMALVLWRFSPNMQKFIPLTVVMRSLFDSGMTYTQIAEASGLSEKDVKAVIKKGEKLVMEKITRAMRGLKAKYEALNV